MLPSPNSRRRSRDHQALNPAPGAARLYEEVQAVAVRVSARRGRAHGIAFADRYMATQPGLRAGGAVQTPQLPGVLPCVPDGRMAGQQLLHVVEHVRRLGLEARGVVEVAPPEFGPALAQRLVADPLGEVLDLTAHGAGQRRELRIVDTAFRRGSEEEFLHQVAVFVADGTDVGQRHAPNDLGPWIDLGESASEDALPADLALGDFHALERAVENLLQVAHDRDGLRR